MIQYSEEPVIEPRTPGILDPPVKPGDDGLLWSCVVNVIARSSCDEAIQLFAGGQDCFAEPVIGRRFAPTRWLAMTALERRLFPTLPWRVKMVPRECGGAS